MAIIDEIPKQYLDISQRNNLISFLYRLPIRKHDKKQIYLEWCKLLNQKATADEIARVMRHDPRIPGREAV